MKNNRGFSLVELIIVIAIMAILIGVLAPAYLKYVEKSRISSDMQLLDAICKSITFAASDPKILEDAASQSLIDDLADPALGGIPLENLENTSNSLAEELKSSLGWNDLQKSTYQPMLKSKHTSQSTIYVQNNGTLNTPYVVWISYTSILGDGNLANAPDKDNIGNCICIK